MNALYVALAIYIVFLAGACALALILGGRTERLVAVTFIAAAIATNLATLFGTHWRGPNWGVMGVDILFFGVLAAIACRSERFWPLWAAASQLAGVLAHLPAVLLPSLPMKIYAATQPFWAFPLLTSLVIGTLRIRRHQRSLNQVAGARLRLRRCRLKA